MRLQVRDYDMKDIVSMFIRTDLTRAKTSSLATFSCCAFEYHGPPLFPQWWTFCVWSPQCLWQAQSHPSLCSIKVAIVPVREFACEKLLPLVKWQLSMGESPSASTNTDSTWEGKKKNTLLFHQLVERSFFSLFLLQRKIFDCIALVMLPFWNSFLFSGALLSSSCSKFHYI